MDNVGGTAVATEVPHPLLFPIGAVGVVIPVKFGAVLASAVIVAPFGVVGIAIFAVDIVVVVVIKVPVVLVVVVTVHVAVVQVVVVDVGHAYPSVRQQYSRFSNNQFSKGG